MKKQVTYLKLARRHSVLSALLKYGENTFLPTDLNVEPRERLVCDELPIKHSEVPQDEVYLSLKWLQVRVNRLERQMKSMELAEFEDFDDEDPDDDFDYEEEDAEESKSSVGEEEDGKAGAKGEGPPAQGDPGRGVRGKRTQPHP